MTVSDGDSSANIPTKQFGTYFQDDWRCHRPADAEPRPALRPHGRATQFDQSKNPNFVAVAGAAKAGLLTGIMGLRELRPRRRRTTRTTSSRASARAYDVRGNGKDVVRAGWGIYTDFGYTNSNVLFAAADAIGQRLRAGVQRRPARRHQEPRRQLLPSRPAALQHPESEPGHSRRGPAVRTVGRPAAPAALDAADQRRLVARADARTRS